MYAELIGILGLSFLLGIRHAIDADHVVAITTIVSRGKEGLLNTALIGILWGIGHSVTVTLVGVLIILYSLIVPYEVGLLAEFLVGLMLVVLGMLNLIGVKTTAPFISIRPLIVGLIHGLAGSAAIALLILSTIHNHILAIFYLLIFHTGVIAGMMMITMLLGVSVNLAKRKSDAINRYLVTFSGLASLIFGLYIMFSVG